ncbi:hypothetical protein WHR41_01831 [Cladosporium halotolerans]|uniref:Tat pathway signal sequence n=1 Tax=Cladosporium halotolerans TaxID=1052096 RepID=A0AB34L2A3_9PEZI
MPPLRPLSGSQDPSSALRLPANRRLSSPTSQRLNTITETGLPPPEERWSRFTGLRTSLSTNATGRTPPPAYDWVPGPNDEEFPKDPATEEKLSRLRKTWSSRTEKRGGWRRVAIIFAIALVVLGLVIGLGVGLTRKGQKGGDNEGAVVGNSTTTQPADDTSLIQQLPLGQYSFVTNLRTQQTTCTPNAATWRCYPYSVLNPSDPSTSASSQTTFDWIIRNTSSSYATNTTGTTAPEGVAANLTISSTNNPFALSFEPHPLTYYSSASNASSARLTFSFDLPKTVFPTSAITPDNSAAQCFFNNTVLAGTIYLSARGNDSTSTENTDKDGFWPYAVEVAQTSSSGEGTPDCYETVNGGVGDRITEGLEPVGEGRECVCGYGNF